MWKSHNKKEITAIALKNSNILILEFNDNDKHYRH